MSNFIKKKRLTQEDIERMMANALLDAYLACPYCEYGDLELDYDTCPECQKKNPLSQLGMI